MTTEGSGFEYATQETEFGTDHFSEPRWIAGEIMLLLITTVTVYVFVSLVYYSWRYRNMARVSGCQQEMRERYLHYSCAAVILIAIARCALHQVIAFLPQGPGREALGVCKTLVMTSRIVYNLAICLTYVHLWLRQRMFYTKNDLKHLRTLGIEIVDWAVLVVIVSTSAVLAYIAFVPLDGDKTITYHKNKCNVFEYNSKVFVMLYAGLSCSYQISLIGLYVYPVIKQKIRQRISKTNIDGSNTNTSAKLCRTMWSGIRRSFVLTIIIIITDATSGSLVWILTKKYPDFLSSTIALNDVNLIVNVICAICTFRNWRKIVFAFPICRRMGCHNDAILRAPKNKSPKHIEAQMHEAEEQMSEKSTSNGFGSTEEKKMLGAQSA